MSAQVNVQEIIADAMTRIPAVSDVVNFTATTLQSLNELFLALKDQGLSEIEMLAIQSTTGGALVENGLSLMTEAKNKLISIQESNNGGVSDGGATPGDDSNSEVVPS